MTYTVPLQAPTSVARKIGANVRRVLASQGRDLTWLSQQIDIHVDTLLRHFSTSVELWLLFDMAHALDVPAHHLTEGAHSDA